jgi:hypothetical protein
MKSNEDAEDKPESLCNVVVDIASQKNNNKKERCPITLAVAYC